MTASSTLATSVSRAATIATNRGRAAEIVVTDWQTITVMVTTVVVVTVVAVTTVVAVATVVAVTTLVEMGIRAKSATQIETSSAPEGRLKTGGERCYLCSERDHVGTSQTR